MNVDAIYCISLNTATDRQKLMKEWWGSSIKFHIVQRMKNPEEGCFTSHQNLLQFAKDSGYKRILVLEDDAFPNYPIDVINKKTNKALELLSGKDWDFLMIGYMPIRTKKTENQGLLKVKSAYTSHAYIANLEKFKKDPWKGIPIDIYLFHTNFKVFATYDNLIVQNSTVSTINPKNIVNRDFLPKLYNGIENMRNVSMHCHIHLPIFFISFMIVALVILIILSVLRKPLYGISIFFLVFFIFLIIFLVDNLQKIP
jgi:glycosyl transferase family 25